MDEMQLEENFRRNLKRRRRELGLTQGEVADRLGVTPQRVTQLERDLEASPTLKQVQQIAKALECSPLTLLLQDEFATV